ncbi:MAG: AAA family ATPase [Clostridium sp.]|uniref:AAA family ATPase n=1 Tax=Clostridium sp. TaxID=1506 RepID=UPI003F2BA558
MKNKLNSNEIIFSLNSNENESDKNIDLMDIEEFKTPYNKIKRILKIKKENYNLYLVDSFLKEKVDMLVSTIEKEYENLEPPSDICYVSIGGREKPFPIMISNGRGNGLKEDIKTLKESYKNAILDFNNVEYSEEKDGLLEDLKTNRSKYLNRLISLASDEGFEMKATGEGFVFIPLSEGKEMDEETYDNLEEEVKEELGEKADKLKEESEGILEALKEIEIKALDKLKDILVEYFDFSLKDLKEDLLLEYILDDDVYNYLEKFYKKIEDALINIYTVDIEENEKDIDKILEEYEIEVIVDNSEYNHPRVIFEEDPSIGKLLGTIEYESQNGNYTTDLSLINAGSLLEANEGCIIVRMKDIIVNNSYHYLKKALLSKKISFDSNKNYLEVLSINGLKLEPTFINVKVIIIGDYESFNILYNNDEDFKILFPVKVEFKEDINLNCREEFIQSYIKEVGVNKCELGISKSAIKAIAKYLVRKAEKRDKINLNLKEIENILVLAEQEAVEESKEIISKEDINKIIYEKDTIEEEYIGMYKENKMLIKLKDRLVGNINGLAVLDTGTHTFGKPMRITCNIFKGEGSIVDIHKDAKLSGRIHEKSISILKSLLWSKLNRKEKMPINMHVSFEQSYGLIEGDSASIAEMISILSAITEKGVKQNIAVTGSLNQFGEVQPIGGVNEKIEGFFRVCKDLNSLEGAGVIIPDINKNELVLKDEVEAEIKKDNFSIYAVKNIEEAIEILLLEEDENIEEFYELLNKKVEEYRK